MSDANPAPTRPAAPPAPAGWEISPQDVAHLIAKGDEFFFVDCRTPDEHETAHIQGAKLMPMQDLDLHLPELKKHQNHLIVIHCHSGRRSLNLTAVLRQEGFTNVKSMAGGIDRWSREIDPSVPRY